MVGMRQAGTYLATAVLIAVMVAAGARADGARNHLDDTDGPYLRLHKSDPVHWRRWGPEALAEAKALARPILLSIGYSACHYCHVMQKESFVDAATAAIINVSFVAVIVDREERPDIDSLYQTLAALMGLPTGWPLTLFLTPGGEPFWGGAYFPKDGFGGVPPFKKILAQVAAVYRDDPKGVADGAAAAMVVLKRQSAAVAGVITMQKVDAAAESFRATIDPFAGGFGEAPKFPWANALEVLWRAGLRNDDGAQRDAVTLSLRKMSESGLYDHVGGGFFRYAVDPNWRVPHYEKMLDVNAALLGLMTEVWRETRDAALERKIRQTVAFLLGEMRLPGGAFAGSLDADSLDGNGKEEEGAFYIWTPKAIEAALGTEAALFWKFYAVGPNEDGEAESGALHQTDATRAAAAKERGLDPAAVGENLEKALGRLRSLRAKRHRPRRDEKVLADWNAMAVRALVEAGLAFGEASWVAAGRRAFDVAARNLTDRDGRLRHWWERGRVGAVATLDDLAQMAGAALTLYEATGQAAYLKQAEAWADAATLHHWDGAGGGFSPLPSTGIRWSCAPSPCTTSPTRRETRRWPMCWPGSTS